MLELTTKSAVELVCVNMILAVGMFAGILVALMGADLATKALGIALAATATAMCVGITRFWPFSMEGPT